MTIAPNSTLSSSLLDTKPKRIHLVASVVMAIIVNVDMFSNFYIHEGNIPVLIATNLMMALGILASLFVFKFVEVRTPRLRKLAYITIPMASLVITILIARHDYQWNHGFAYFSVVFATLFCSVGIVTILAIPLIWLVKWINEV